MSLPYSDPSNPALPSPLFSDLAAVRGDHMRANNAAIFADLANLDERLLRQEALEQTASSGGTLTLSATNEVKQRITGTLAHTVVLPDVSTLYLGFTFTIINDSTQPITVNSSGSNLVATVLPGRAIIVTCILITGTTAASWKMIELSGNVTGPASSVVGNIPVFDDIGGKTLTDSGYSLATLVRDLVYPIGCFYIQFADANSNTTATAFPSAYSPATLFGGVWTAQWNTEGIFFKTQGDPLSQTNGELNDRTNGLQTDAIQGHKHGCSQYGGTGSAGSGLAGGAGETISAVTVLGVTTDSAYGTARVEKETRGRNRMIIVWKRTG